MGNAMARRPLLSAVAALEQPFHVFGIGGEDTTIVGLWLRSFRQPPETFDRIFDADAPDSDPLRGGRELGRVIPIEFLGQTKAMLADEGDQDFKVAERSDGMSRLPAAPQIDD